MRGMRKETEDAINNAIDDAVTRMIFGVVGIKAKQINEFELQHLDKVATHVLASYPETMIETEQGRIFEQVIILRPKGSEEGMSRCEAMGRYPFAILRYNTPRLKPKANFFCLQPYSMPVYPPSLTALESLTLSVPVRPVAPGMLRRLKQAHAR